MRAKKGSATRAKNGGAQRAKKNGARANGSRRDGAARRASEREMAEMFGFTPEFFDAVPTAVLEHAWGMQRDFELQETALSPKSKELIGLALAAHIKCRYCIYFHTQAARFHGATDEELREAVSMGGFTAMMSSSITGAQVDYDHFKGEVDRALDHMRANPPKAAQRATKASRSRA